MFETCKLKQTQVKLLFDDCVSEEEKYNKIIKMGKLLPTFPDKEKVPANIVKGCQSVMYLKAALENGKIHFYMASDALISAGLAMLLLEVYNDETPETILKCPPDYLEELGIGASLSPSRANGLYSIHLRMKQEALRLFMESIKS